MAYSVLSGPDRRDRGHSGVFSILGMVDFRVSIACKDRFWNFRFFENSVRQTIKSANAPWEITTPNLVLYI